MKLFLKIITVLSGIVVALIIGIMIVFYGAGNAAKKTVDGFTPETSTLPDGKYHGSFRYLRGQIEADVTFEIKNGSLWLIRFDELFATSFSGASHKVYFAIDDPKELDFDAVTGATITSYLAKAAIKDAIERGPHEP